MRLKNYKIYLMHNDAAGKVKKEENVKKYILLSFIFHFGMYLYILEILESAEGCRGSAERCRESAERQGNTKK